MNISEAKNMRSGVNIEALVENKSETRNVNLKDGRQVNVCDATIKDDSGEMKLTLWGSDIEAVSIGDVVRITNGYTNTFKDQVSLTKGKFGQMEIIH